MSDRQMSASHPWEVKNCSWWYHLVGTSVGARCAGCRRRERTFQRGQEGLARRAAEEEEEAGRENSAGPEGEMCCNDRHMARRQVGGRTPERYWTSQSEERREPRQLVLLEVLDNTLKNWKKAYLMRPQTTQNFTPSKTVKSIDKYIQRMRSHSLQTSYWPYHVSI